MSFLKITDPAKRDLIVADFLETKRRIQQNFLNEKLGDIGLQQDLVKLYKPIVDSQSTISKEQNALLSTIKENSAATSSALQALPASISSSIKAIQFPQYQSIEEASEDDPVSDKPLIYGSLAATYLKKSTRKKEESKQRDTNFGIHSKADGECYIGNEPIMIEGNETTMGDNTYK